MSWDLLSPGKAADVVFIPSPEDYDPRRIMIRGGRCFQEGTSLVEPRHVDFPDSLFSTVRLDCPLDEPARTGRVRTMSMINRLVTGENRRFWKSEDCG
jgi:adenine deaminase